MTLADDLKPLVHSIRSIPGELGLRPYTVSVTVRAGLGQHNIESTGSETTTAITEGNGQPPKVRFLSDEDRAFDALPAGSVEVGPITPEHATGGISFATLTGQGAADHTLLHYTLTGPQFPSGAKYRLIGSRSDRALHYKLTLAPIAST